MTRRRAAIVVDLGFGDAGKGLVTDALVRALGAEAVVRWNGGAQAGHNVVAPDGRHHTFSQFGAGSFVAGVETWLTRAMVVHPGGLAREAEVLEAKGVRAPLDLLRVSADATVITPFHQAANRLRELSRGTARHGSCGLGVGEAVSDARRAPERAVRMRHLAFDAPLPLRALQEEKRAELASVLLALRGDEAAERERVHLEDTSLLERWLQSARNLARRLHVIEDAELEARMGRARRLVFEGAQGVLLDEWRGFHPHTTWSTCTPGPARELAERHFDRSAITTFGVLRSYTVRHGAGPFPTEDSCLGKALVDRHNVEGPWQGALRVGALDLVLHRYAREVSGRVDGLVLTHLDALDRAPTLGVCEAYERPRAGAPEAWNALVERAPEGGRITRLCPSASPDLAHQEALGPAARRGHAVSARGDRTGGSARAGRHGRTGPRLPDRGDLARALGRRHRLAKPPPLGGSTDVPASSGGPTGCHRGGRGRPGSPGEPTPRRRRGPLRASCG